MMRFEAIGNLIHSVCDSDFLPESSLLSNTGLLIVAYEITVILLGR